MKIQCLILLIFGCYAATGQYALRFERQFSDTLPKEAFIQASEIREHIWSTIPEDLKGGEYDRAAYRFADQNGLQAEFSSKNGKVISDWPELSDYVNQVLQNVLPDELKSDKMIRAFLNISSDFNAHMGPSGSTYVDLGVLAEIKDEATLAAILAHEVAHYYKQHSIKQFVKREDGEFDPFLLGRNTSRNSFSQDVELQADSLSIAWMYASGYNMEGISRSFDILAKIESNYISRSLEMWRMTATTHPLSSERIDALESFKAKHAETPGADFIVDPNFLKEAQESIRAIVLRDYLNSFDYSLCIERAFRYHLDDLSNPMYMYYIMEGIRRSCYLRPELWTANFISYRYFDVVETKDRTKKVPRRSNLFSSDVLGPLRMSQEEFDACPGKKYWNEVPKFFNNEQAFNYFYKLSQTYNEPECVLSCALSYADMKDTRNTLLRRYLSFEDIGYREYAELMLADSLQAALPDQKMVVFAGMTARVRQGEEDILIRGENEDLQPQLSSMLQTVLADQQQHKSLVLKDLIYTDLNDYRMLDELEDFSWLVLISEGQKTSLHTLDPRYWQTLYDFEVNEIEYVRCSYLESRKKEKTREAYAEVFQLDYDSLFSQQKRTKSVDVYITSVRDKPESVMKIRYFVRNEPLKFKDPAEEQIIDLIRLAMIRKEERAYVMDREYGK